MFRQTPARSPNPRGRAASPTADDDDRNPWHETRAETAFATQWLGLDPADDHPAAAVREIGRRIGPNQRELFVSCAPDLALRQQFEHHGGPFIAVHEIATQASRKLLTALAAATGRAMQTLAIRRQGYGTVLAVLEFVELPTVDGSELRIYSTTTDADTAARHGLARALLAHSRLGIVMVGSLPGHAMATALAPIRDAMLAGPWPNRELILLPLASGSALQTEGVAFARGTGVGARVTPQVFRPADAWEHLQSAWSGLRAQAAKLPQIRGSTAGGSRTAPTAPSRVSGGFVERRARPRQGMTAAASSGAGARREAGTSTLQRFVDDIAALPGVASCCVFETASGRVAAGTGVDPSTASLAAQGRALLETATASAQALGFGTAFTESTLTVGAHHLMLRAVPGRPGQALHVALDRASANPVLAQLQVRRLEAQWRGVAGTD